MGFYIFSAVPLCARGWLRTLIVVLPMKRFIDVFCFLHHLVIAGWMNKHYTKAMWIKCFLDNSNGQWKTSNRSFELWPYMELFLFVLLGEVIVNECYKPEEERAFSLLMNTKIINYGLAKAFVKPFFMFWIICLSDFELNFIDKL